jgi:hypothetical protein
LLLYLLNGWHTGQTKNKLPSGVRLPSGSAGSAQYSIAATISRRDQATTKSPGKLNPDAAG